MKNKVVVLYLSAVLAFNNNSIIASKANISNGNDQPTNTNKSEDYKKFGDKKDGTFGVEGEGKTQWSFASQNFSINVNLENVESSFKKKLNDEKISGDVFSIKGNFMVSFLKNITYKRAFPATFGDARNFCDGKKIMVLSSSNKWKKTGWDVLSWFLDAERELSIYGYKITQRISPLSVKSDCGYRLNLFSVKNVFNVLNRLSCTSLNPGCMDFFNVSIMRTDAYIENKEKILDKKHKLAGLCIDVFSVNKKFSNLLEIGFVFGTHYNVGADEKFSWILGNAALQFSLNCTCKYIFMNLKLIGYFASNNIMCSNDKMFNELEPRNICLDYTNMTKDGCIVPVKIKLGSSVLKGKKMTAWGKKSLIFKDICLDIKSDLFFRTNPAVLLSYDLYLNFSLEKYIDIAVGICSHDRGLGMYGKVKELHDNKYDKYDKISPWIYTPTPYLKIQINWLELRK